MPTPWLGHALGLALFSLGYYAPLLLDPSSLVPADDKLRVLLNQALSSNAVRIEIGRNVATHALLLLAVYGLLAAVASRVASALTLRPSLVLTVMLIGGWAWLMAINGVLFPLSNHAAFYSSLASPALAIGLGLLLAAAVALALATLWRSARPRRPWLAVPALALVVMPALALRDPAPAQASRHVIIVGVDSLGPDVLSQHREQLPHLAGLVDQATVFERAYTPLARTYPAWMTILSGRPPAEHGAVFNLRDVDRVQRSDLLSHRLAARGYETILAIDERRFSNIDESFGFDRVVGPRAGALDFVLQSINDTPLTNLLLQSRAGDWGLPYSRFNAASHVNYDAHGFVDTIAAAPAGDRPLFLATHFESAHFPFKTRHARLSIEHDNDLQAAHVAALSVVDTQIGRMMAALARRGYLDHALVIVLSDHGEGLGDVQARTTRSGQAFAVTSTGHGGEVLSEQEHRVVLAALRYENGRVVPPAAPRPQLVSLADVRGMAESYAASGQPVLPVGDRCMSVETGLRLEAAADYTTLDVATVAAAGAAYYQIDTAGRMHLREEGLSRLVALKDVGWRCPDRITVHASRDQRYHAYRIDADGRSLTEIEPPAADVARIVAYRAQLAEAVAP